MAMLIKKSVGMKSRIQMRMLGAVVVLYSLLVISGVFVTKTRKTTFDKMNNFVAIAQTGLNAK